MKLKKIVSFLCVIAMTISIGTVVVSADETGVGDRIFINNDAPSFEEVVFVENGKTYLPLRLVFPNLNDKENKIGMTISWGESYPVIHLIHGGTTGGDAIENHSAPPYEGVRKCVDILWTGDAMNGIIAELSIMEYTYDEQGEMKIINEDQSQILKDPMFLKVIDGGGRMFVSIEDINRIASWLGLDSEYSVKLYK